MSNKILSVNRLAALLSILAIILFFLIHPGDAYFMKGCILELIHDYPGAIKAFSKTIKFKPGFRVGYASRASVKFKLKDYQGTIDDYSAAIDLNGFNKLEYYYNRGVAKHYVSHDSAAIEDFNKAIIINPNDDESYTGRGASKSCLGDYQDAIKDFDTAIMIKHNSEFSYNNRGIAKLYLHDTLGAIEDYKRAIEINSKYEAPYYNLGNISYCRNDYHEAIEDYNKALEINPKHANSFYQRGLAKIASKANDSGCLDLANAVKLGQIDANELIKKYCR